jgi:hypothetical protein
MMRTWPPEVGLSPQTVEDAGAAATAPRGLKRPARDPRCSRRVHESPRGGSHELVAHPEAAIGRRGICLAILAIALLGLAAGWAYSAVPGSDGVIHACYDKKGNLLVVDPGAGGQCAASQTPLSWSQTGPPGPAGPAGPSGPLAGWEVVRVLADWPPHFQQAVTASCPTGKRPLGGGYFPVNVQGSLNVLGTYPSGPNGDSGGIPPTAADFTGWSLYALNTDGTDHATAIVYAVCATV